MAKVKTIKKWEQEAQDRADTFNKTVYLYALKGRYQITFKSPFSVLHDGGTIKTFNPR